jgi:hydrogenase/urease accessory protein HupE
VVEYALLIASTSAETFGVLTSNLSNKLSGLDWHMLVYVAIGLLALRLASWAFRATL